jgi:hypothetical protein
LLTIVADGLSVGGRPLSTVFSVCVSADVFGVSSVSTSTLLATSPTSPSDQFWDVVGSNWATSWQQQQHAGDDNDVAVRSSICSVVDSIVDAIVITIDVFGKSFWQS